MLAKGRLLGIQFESLFEDGLYLELGARANRLGMRMKRAISESGFSFASDSYTNQQFAVLPDALVEALGGHYKFERNGKPDAGHTVVRFVTSWATDETAGRAVRPPTCGGWRAGRNDRTAEGPPAKRRGGRAARGARHLPVGHGVPLRQAGVPPLCDRKRRDRLQMLFAGTRFLLAGALTLAFGAAAGRRAPLPARRNYGGVLLLGLVQTTAQYVFFYVGLANTTGSRGSIIDASAAFIGVILAHFFCRGDRMTAARPSAARPGSPGWSCSTSAAGWTGRSPLSARGSCCWPPPPPRSARW